MLERARRTLALVELKPTRCSARGVRLAVLYPPIYAMQVRAIVEAAAAVASDGDVRTWRSCCR